MPSFQRGRRIVPDSVFYLPDIIPEKSLSPEAALVGNRRYDAKMRHRKNTTCEKKRFQRIPLKRNHRKRQPIPQNGVTISEKSLPQRVFLLQKGPIPFFMRQAAFHVWAFSTPPVSFGRAFLMATRWAWIFHQEEMPFPMPAGNRERPPHLMRPKRCGEAGPFQKNLPVSHEKRGGNKSLPGKAYATIRRCGSCPQRSSGAGAQTNGRRSRLHPWGWRWSWWSSLRRQRRGRRGAGRS